MGKMVDLVKKRRSIRRYKKKTVPDELIEQILEAGRWAPSGLNNEPWRFVIIKEGEMIKRVAAFTSYRKIMEKSPLLICVFYDKDAGYDRTKDVMAIGASIQNMLLAVQDLALGACWMGEILKQKEKIHQLLETPPTYELMAVITIGYPSESPSPTPRTALPRLIFKRI